MNTKGCDHTSIKCECWADETQDDACNTCGGSGRWESTTEDSPTVLLDMGPCPECHPYGEGKFGTGPITGQPTISVTRQDEVIPNLKKAMKKTRKYGTPFSVTKAIHDSIHEIERLRAAGDAMDEAHVDDLCDCYQPECAAIRKAHRDWQEARRD